MKKIHPNILAGRTAYLLKQATLIQVIIFFVTVLPVTVLPFESFGQVTALIYSSPQNYAIATAIAPLAPASHGVAAPGYSASPSTLASGFSSPIGVVVDAAGNVYVADTFNNAVKEIPVGGGSPVTLGSGFNTPCGLALDAAGNVYVADAHNNAVKEIPIGGGSPVTLGSGFSNPVSVALDAAGNIYVCDSGNNAVKKIPAGGGAPVVFDSGGGTPNCVAVDAAGNVYVTYSNNTIKKFPAGGGSAVALGSGFNNPVGVAVDAIGNVYVSDSNNNMVKEIPVGGGAPVTLGSGFNEPQCVATDGAGNVYVADFHNNAVKKIKPIGGYFLSMALPAGLSFNNTTGIISGTPTAISPATNYTITAYSSSNFISATVNISVGALPVASYASPQNYIAGTAITPLAPTSSGVAAPGYSTSAVTLASGFNSPIGIAVDAAGNVYVADAGNNAVKKIPATGGSPITLGSGFSGPHDVAVDAAGNVYVADRYNNAVKVIPVGGGSPATIGSGFSNPFGVAVDAAGNVYVADYGNNAVKKIPAGNGAPVTIGTGFSDPTGVAVDAAGNVYVSDFGHGAIQKIPAGGGSPFILRSGFNFPMGVAVDASGNVFVCEYGNTTLKEIPVSGGSVVSLGPILSYQYAAAIDVAGNIYVADWANNAAKVIRPVGGYYLNKPLPAGLSLNPATGAISGTPTAITPAANYTITAYNSFGGVPANVNITVNEPAPTISYSSPQPYTVGTTIAPLTPVSSGVAAPGFGNTPVFIGSGFSSPACTALDAAGNIYVADYNNGAVKKIPVGGGPIVVVSSEFANPHGIALDAAGNIYVADYGGGALKEIPAAGGAVITIATVDSPTSVVLDAAGNIYVGCLGTGSVLRFPAGGGHVVAWATGLGSIWSLAIDAAGNIYVANEGGVYEIPVVGSTITIGSGFSTPIGVAVDAAGNVYVADFNEHAIKMVPAGNGVPVSIGSGFIVPTAVTAGPDGKIYVGDEANSHIEVIIPNGGYYISKALPAGLSFSNTTGIISGKPLAISPATNYAITAYNTGGSNSASVNIKVVAANNANLSSMHPSTGVLSPSFLQGTINYTSTVANSITSITITPTAADAVASIKVNGAPVVSGTASASILLLPGQNIIKTVVTAADGVTTKTYTLTVTRTPLTNANLASLHLSNGTLSPAFAAATVNYTANVANSTASMTVTPTTPDTTERVKVNGAAVASGLASLSIPLAAGPNIITIVVTAQDGITTKTYTITVTRAPSVNANLANLALSVGTLSPAFASGHIVYTASVNNATSSITMTPATADAAATVKVNGNTVVSGSASASISLAAGPNTITTVVTAQDGTTTKTYTITITRAASANANLASMHPSVGGLTPSFLQGTTSYTESVGNAVTSMKITPTAADPSATIQVNGIAVVSGSASQSLPLVVGPNTITTVVTAQNTSTTKTYTLTVTRATGPLGVAENSFATLIDGNADDGIIVHQGVSPNGDGSNDGLTIEGITKYPDNKLAIMNRSGVLIYEAKGYDNSSKIFNGHSSKTGRLQQPGTYFYSLEYKAGGVAKHKTGYIILKW